MVGGGVMFGLDSGRSVIEKSKVNLSTKSCILILSLDGHFFIVFFPQARDKQGRR